MRVVMVVHGYPPSDLGGTEVHAASVAGALAARGHAVSVLTGTRRGGDGRRSVVDTIENGVAVRWIGRPEDDAARSGLNDAWVRAEFERLLDETEPDVVHIQHLLHLSGDLIEAAVQRGVPAVATLHDLWLQCPSLHPRPQDRHPSGRRWGVGCVWHHELRPQRIAANLRRGRLPRISETLRRPAFLRRQLDLTEALLAPSRYIVDAFVRFGVAPERLHLMPHGVGLEPRSSIRRPAGPVRFGFVGSLVPTKGVHVLCEAFNRVAGNPTLDIFGPAYSARYLRRLRGYLGPRIRYAGEFAPQDAERVYGSLDVLVLPSLVPESFGLVAAEAQACGVPVVASSIGALPERIRAERDGLLVPPGDVGALRLALSRLNDPVEVQRLSSGIRPPRSTASYTEELEELYVELASRSPRSPNDRLSAVKEAGSRG